MIYFFPNIVCFRNRIKPNIDISKWYKFQSNNIFRENVCLLFDYQYLCCFILISLPDIVSLESSALLLTSKKIKSIILHNLIAQTQLIVGCSENIHKMLYEMMMMMIGCFVSFNVL